LAASTTYFYRVVATNANGESAPSTVVTATTASSVPDTEPPTAPSKLKATVAKRKINLSWTGSADNGSGVAGYRVYRSGTESADSFVLLTTTSSTSVSIDAPSGSVFWYRVTAYDGAANESAPSAVVRAEAR
jgi:fibronectin type 3 domain-containing protein